MDNQFENENQFNLIKTSFLTVGGLIHQCVKFLPNTKGHGAQFLALGDTRGTIYITHYKKTQPEILVRTNPYPKEISSILVDQDPSKDKIFFAVGNSIYVINRTYSTKYKIEFDLADDIKTFQVIENNIWTVSNTYLSQYEYGEITTEKGTYDNGCKILNILVSKLFGAASPIVILGSEDNKIKLVENSEEFFTLPTKGGVTCFCPIKMSTYDNSENNILFGTTTGTHGVLNIKGKDEVKILFEYNDDKNYSDVVDIKVFDIDHNGINEIILIRSDGIVEIYSIGETLFETSLIVKHNTHEHLTGIDIGKYKTNDKYEIMLISLSGLVFSLTPEINPSKKKAQVIDKKTLAKGLIEEAKEVENLEKTYNKKREEFEKKQQAINNSISKNSYKVELKFTLNQKESVFVLILDSEFPIEIALVHCSQTRLDILDVRTKDVSMNLIDQETMDEDTRSHSKFLATFKPKEATHRLELVVRTYEGVTDMITVTVIPANIPKTAQIIQVPVYALSFHKKYEPEFEEEVEVIPMDNENEVNILTVEGVTGSEINQILHLVIPNIPAQMKGDTAKYLLRSTLLNTLVEINIDMNGKCEIKAMHLSTLMTIKEQITKEADLRKKEVQFEIKVRTMSVFKILEILNPKIEEIFSLETKYKIVKAFKEIESIELTNLPEEYIQILNKADEINSKYSQRTLNLKYYISILEQLLLDLKKVVNINDYDERYNEIQSLFEDYSYDKIKKIFSV